MNPEQEEKLNDILVKGLINIKLNKTEIDNKEYYIISSKDMHKMLQHIIKGVLKWVKNLQK